MPPEPTSPAQVPAQPKVRVDVIAKFMTFKQEQRGSVTVYQVLNTKSGNAIGEIKNYPPWRQQCFFPSPRAVFSADCLQDVVNFMDKLNGKEPVKATPPAQDQVPETTSDDKAVAGSIFGKNLIKALGLESVRNITGINIDADVQDAVRIRIRRLLSCGETGPLETAFSEYELRPKPEASGGA